MVKHTGTDQLVPNVHNTQNIRVLSVDRGQKQTETEAYNHGPNNIYKVHFLAFLFPDLYSISVQNRDGNKIFLVYTFYLPYVLYTDCYPKNSETSAKA